MRGGARAACGWPHGGDAATAGSDWNRREMTPRVRLSGGQNDGAARTLKNFTDVQDPQNRSPHCLESQSLDTVPGNGNK